MKKQQNENETTEPAAEAGDVTATSADPPPQDTGLESQSGQPGIEDARETPEGVTLTRLEAENAELRSRIRIGEARRVLTDGLTGAGARSPALLFEAVKGEIEFDDEGNAKNSAAIIDRLKREYPEQFGARVPSSIDAGAGQVAPPRLTRSALARMKPSEIAELDWAEVRRVLASN